MFEEKRKFIRTSITEDTSAYHSVVADFETEKYPGEPLLDTKVSLHIPEFCITYNDREKFMQELAKFIRKFAI